MRRKIRTADEEMNGAAGLLLFSIVWYAIIIKNMLANGFHSSMLILLIGGLLAPAQGIRMVQRALYFRRLHEQCIQGERPERGRIVNVTREYHDRYDSDRRRHRITYYFLTVELISPETGVAYTIKSDAYRIPVHKYLSSPYVEVYTDRGGWKYVIDGFQLKKSRREPDVFQENPYVYEKDIDQPTMLFRVIFIAVLVMMLFQILGIGN